MLLKMQTVQKKLPHNIQGEGQGSFDSLALANVNSINVGSKVLILCVTIISLILMKDWRQLFVNLLFLIVLSCLAGIIAPMARKIKPLVFLCLGIVIIHSLFNPNNDSFVYFFGLEGFKYGLKVTLRLLCIVMAANFLLLTTDTATLIRWFGQINSDLGTILGLALSIIPVMRRQMATTLEVQSARGLRRDRMMDRFFAFIAVIVPVIVKSIIRAHTMAQLLYLRGYDQKPTSIEFKMARRDWYLLSFGFAFFFTNLYFSLIL